MTPDVEASTEPSAEEPPAEEPSAEEQAGEKPAAVETPAETAAEAVLAEEPAAEEPPVEEQRGGEQTDNLTLTRAEARVGLWCLGRSRRRSPIARFELPVPRPRRRRGSP